MTRRRRRSTSGGRLFTAGKLMDNSAVTVLDWGIAAFVLALVLWGFREGPVVGVLITAVTVAFVWAFAVAALHAPGSGQLRRDVRDSLILSNLTEVLPPSETVITALRRIDPAPEVIGAPAPVAPPDPAIASDPDVVRAGDSVVRVFGTACGLGVEGSGWAIGPDLIVTNAHVVAGEDDTTVTTRGGASLDATAVHYDPRNDLALLKVAADIPTLPLRARSRVRHGRRRPRLSAERPLCGHSGSLRRHPRGDQRRLLWPRSHPAHARLPPRHRPQRQLRRPPGRLPRPRDGNDLRRDHLRPPGRLCHP